MVGFSLGLVLAVAAAYVVWSVFALRSGHTYTGEEAELDRETYAGVIDEVEGGVPGFLWITFVALALWTVTYLYIHRADFGAILGG